MELYKNCNRVTRKKVPLEKAKEFGEKSKEYHEYATQKHRVVLEEGSRAIKKTLDTQLVAAYVMPDNIYKEMYGAPHNLTFSGDQVAYDPTVLYLEQIYRLFPKEMYMRTFFPLQIAQYIAKHHKQKKDSMGVPEENFDFDGGDGTELEEDVDESVIKKEERIEEEKLFQQILDRAVNGEGLLIPPLEPMGIKEIPSGEDDDTDPEESATTSRAKDELKSLSSKI